MAQEGVVVLSRREREELEVRLRSRTARAADARRARLIVMLADGEPSTAIQETLACSATYITRWKTRFLQGRLEGLHSRHRGRLATALIPRTEARILSATKDAPKDGSTHWSTRKLAKQL